MKFKLGDRVIVYCKGNLSFKGIITDLHSKYGLSVTEEGFYSAHDDSPFHPKQCRRLVKKKDKEQITTSDVFNMINRLDNLIPDTLHEFERRLNDIEDLTKLNNISIKRIREREIEKYIKERQNCDEGKEILDKFKDLLGARKDV
jgi:hypothetical protein